MSAKQFGADLLRYAIDRRDALDVPPGDAVAVFGQIAMVFAVGLARPGEEMLVIQKLAERMVEGAPAEIAEKCRLHLRRVEAAGRA